MVEKLLKQLGLDSKDIAEVIKAEKEENKDFEEAISMIEKENHPILHKFI